MRDTGRNQAAVDQGKNPDPLNPLKTEHAGMAVKGRVRGGEYG